MLDQSTVRPISDLQIQFPTAQVVKLQSGREVLMRRIPITDVPKLTEAYVSIATIVNQGGSVGDILNSLGKDLLELLGPCILNVKLSELDASDAPELLAKFIELNFSEEILGKWWGLFQDLVTRIPGGDGILEQAGLLPKQKSPLKRR